MFIHNQQLRGLIKDRYSLDDIHHLWDIVQSHGVLNFPGLDNGLFPAAVVSRETAYTGYANVWVRDNVQIAHAHHFVGQTDVAARTMRALMSFFQSQRPRFEAIIQGDVDPEEVINRPHIRFDGTSLAEIDQKWPHAQNDALGYFLWLYCRLAREGHLQVGQAEQETLWLFARYFEAIQFWHDQDSGHWEERRKISASSIGTVVAGLRELRRLQEASSPGDVLNLLIASGESALRHILPWECRQADPAKNRQFDAALLFLIFPLEAVDADMAGRILADVTGHLQGDHGIRRYLGDSFWAPDYKQKLPPELRTIDMGDDMAARDALARPGCEAQWCIFDPLLSTIHGRQYQASRDPKRLELQTIHLNRAIGQITGDGTGQSHVVPPVPSPAESVGRCATPKTASEGTGGTCSAHVITPSDSSTMPPWKCPELYYLENGQYVANDATPLLWTQANLMMALKTMCDSAGHLASPES